MQSDEQKESVLGEEKTVKIRLENISKIFGVAKTKLVVFQDINAEIFKQEFVSVIGPSGGGKSTLLFIMAGLLPTTEGRVLIDGKEVTEPGRDRGLVFQQDSIFPWRSVIENVEYGLELRSVSQKERREVAMNYLKLVNLEKFANFWPKELSGGMKKRVALAMVWANQPDVLLMDEPFGSLDYPTKVDLQNKLLEMWGRDKKTTVFVTHDIEEAVFLSDRIFVLTDGNIRHTLKVPFGRPRTDDLRTDKEFQEIRRQLWGYTARG